MLYILFIIYTSSPSHPVYDAKLNNHMAANSINELFVGKTGQLMLWTMKKLEGRLELWENDHLIGEFVVEGDVCCMVRENDDLILVKYRIQEEDMM